jgi:hypothetical protein
MKKKQNDLKFEVVHAIKKNFPQYAQFLIEDDSTEIFNLPNAENYIAGLVVQVYKMDIYIRAYPPNSVCLLDSIEELIYAIGSIIRDELIFAVGYKKGVWSDTTLNFSNQDLELEKDVDYKIFSWSGKFDKEVKASLCS